MSNLSFAFEGQEIRFVGTPENPEWVASDVLAALYPETDKRNRRNYLNKIPAKWKGHKQIMTVRGKQSSTTLYEPGLYMLINRSDSKKAIPFQEWLYEEVIPSIRKTGSYSLPSVEPPQPDTGIPISTPQPIASLPSDLSDLISETNRLYGDFETVYTEPTPALQIAKEIGDRLLQLKEQVGHGNWEAFREANIKSPHTGQPMPSTTAALYQRVAKHWDALQQGNVQSIRDAIYLLRRDRGGMIQTTQQSSQKTLHRRLELLKEGVDLADRLGGFDEHQQAYLKAQVLEILMEVDA